MFDLSAAIAAIALLPVGTSQGAAPRRSIIAFQSVSQSELNLLRSAEPAKLERLVDPAKWTVVVEGSTVMCYQSSIFGLAALNQLTNALGAVMKPGQVLSLSDTPDATRKFLTAFLASRIDGFAPSLATKFKFDALRHFTLKSGNVTVTGPVVDPALRTGVDDSFYGQTQPATSTPKPSQGRQLASEQPIQFAYSPDFGSGSARLRAAQALARRLEQVLVEAEGKRDAFMTSAVDAIFRGTAPANGTPTRDLPNRESKLLLDQLRANPNRYGFADPDSAEAFFRTATVERVENALYLTVGMKTPAGDRIQVAKQIGNRFP